MAQPLRPGPPALPWPPISEAAPYSDSSSLSSKAFRMKKAHLTNMRIFKNIHNNLYYVAEGNLKGRILEIFGAIATSTEALKNSFYLKVTAFVHCKTDILL